MVKIKKRNLVFVIVFSLFTLGIYPIYWVISTTLELRKLNKHAIHPIFLLVLALPILIPLAVALLAMLTLLSPLLILGTLIFYLWSYSKALSIASKNAVPAWLLFILWLLMPPIAVVISQVELNKLAIKKSGK